MEDVPEKEIKKFFETMGKLIDLPGLTANEKGHLIRAKAEKYGALDALDEFIGQTLVPSNS